MATGLEKPFFLRARWIVSSREAGALEDFREICPCVAASGAWATEAEILDDPLTDTRDLDTIPVEATEEQSGSDEGPGWTEPCSRPSLAGRMEERHKPPACPKAEPEHPLRRLEDPGRETCKWAGDGSICWRRVPHEGTPKGPIISDTLGDEGTTLHEEPAFSCLTCLLLHSGGLECSVISVGSDDFWSIARDPEILGTDSKTWSPLIFDVRDNSGVVAHGDHHLVLHILEEGSKAQPYCSQF